MSAGITRAGDGGKLIMMARCEVARKKERNPNYMII